MIAEVALAVAAVTLVVSNLRIRGIKNRDVKLLAEHSAMADHIVESGNPFGRADSDPWYAHQWSDPTKDVIYTSKLPWSYDRVVVETTACEKCKILHRHIVKGMELATSKGLHFKEGVFYSGVRVSDPGCPFPSKLVVGSSMKNATFDVEHGADNLSEESSGEESPCVPE